MTHGWRVEDRGGVRHVRCAELDAIPGIAHGFSTRVGSGDLGSHDDLRPEVADRRERFVEAIGLAGRTPTLLHQVHGCAVVDAGSGSFDVGAPDADAVIAIGCAARHRAPAVRWADCVPLLLADRGGSSVAAVHAGWRGTAAGVVNAAVAVLSRSGVSPRSLVAALGPAIGACCYVVGPDVLEAVARSADAAPREVAIESAGGLRLDLRRAVRMQLLRAGVERDSIHEAPWCTACTGDLFDSYRRLGARAGRQMACIGWPGPAPP